MPKNRITSSRKGAVPGKAFWSGIFFVGIYLLSFNYLILTLERSEGREKERERNIDAGKKRRCERETSIGCLHWDQEPNPQPRHMPRPRQHLLSIACLLANSHSNRCKLVSHDFD